MANKAIKFSQEELQQLATLQSSYQQITFSMGLISLQKISLNTREQPVLQTLSDLRTQESELATTLTEKYGKGSLNVETGEFTPTPEDTPTPEKTDKEVVKETK